MISRDGVAGYDPTMHPDRDFPFAFLDPTRKINVREHNLPHWEQPGATYFITFRTADSMPVGVLREWLHERDAWLRLHHINADDEDWHIELRRLPEAQQGEFHQEFTRQFHEALDQGCGECLLRQPRLAGIVAASFRHFDGDRYRLGDFVVMPNHVHLLAWFFGGEDALKRQCQSWKKFTAAEINGVLGHRGHFWQAESYDHLVRDMGEFAAFQSYIASNPLKARLREGEYLYCPWKPTA